MTLHEIKRRLEQIVVTEGEDRGVVLLSSESPTKVVWSSQTGGFVTEYVHPYFSPLGDALIELYDIVSRMETEEFRKKG